MVSKPTYAELEQRVHELEQKAVHSRKVEEALMESEKRFRLLYERTPLGYQSLDENGYFLEVNKAWSDTLGYTRDDVIGKDFGDFLHPDWVEHFKDNFPRFKAIGEVLGVEFEMVKKDGSYILVSFNGKIGKDQNGHFKQTHCILHDITESRRLEDALKQSEERYRAMFEKAQVGLFRSSISEGKLIACNEYFARKTGYESQEECCSDYNITNHYSDPTKRRKLLDALSKNGIITDYEIQVSDRHGTPVWVNLSAKIYPNEGILEGAIVNITARKLSEEDLKENESKFRTLYENMAQGVFYQRADGVIDDCNPAVLDMFGLSRDEFMGRTSTDPRWKVVHEDGTDIPGDQHPSMVALRTGKPVRDVIAGVFNPLKQGYVWLSINAIPQFKDDEDIPFQVFVTLHDITDRKIAENALKESEAKFRMIAENTSDSVWLLDLNTMQLTYASSSIERINGYTVEEQLNRHFEDIFTPQSLKKVMETIADGLKRDAERKNDDRITERLEWQEYHKRGHLIWVESETALIKDDNGKPTGVIGVSRDITGRKHTERKLLNIEERYRAIFDRSLELVYIHDREGCFLDANPELLKLLGYSKEEFMEQKFSTIIDLTQIEKTFLFSQKNINNKDTIELQEYRLKAKNGDIKNVEIRSTLIYDNGEPYAILGLGRDVTERKKLEAQLRQAEKMQSIGTLAGGIAHDFNNILSIILGNTELALDDMPDWLPSREFLEEVRQASLRAKDMVQQLLTFTRKSEAKQKPVKVSQVAKESLKLLRSSIPANIEISQNIPDDGYTIKADTTQIHQILMNLVTNSSQAIEGSGIIDVALENTRIDQKQIALVNDLHPGDYVKLTVKDTGSGIDQKDLNRIFDPYFTTKEFGKGTGMGLAVVHGLTKSHGGSIIVESKPDHGTTFSIFFPACNDLTENEKLQENKPPGGTERVLIIDDEKSIALLGQRRLERLGYTVESRTNPLEALELIKANPDQFDLIITDMAMPKMTGDVLATEIRKIKPGLPVILCTGYSDRIDEDKAKNIGIKAFLMKPMDMKALAEAVRKVLDEK